MSATNFLQMMAVDYRLKIDRKDENRDDEIEGLLENETQKKTVSQVMERKLENLNKHNLRIWNKVRGLARTDL